jgi:hypothetical protein
MSVANQITEAFNALNKERLVCKGCGRFNNFCMCKEQRPMEKEQIDYETMSILLADPIMCGIIQTLCKQTQKGVKTYGHTLSDCPDENLIGG